MASSTGLVANDLGDTPEAVSMAKQVVTRIMATVERMKDPNGQNAIVQAMARMPVEVLPGGPAIAEVDQVAPDGFGLSEKQLAEHTEYRKKTTRGRDEMAPMANRRMVRGMELASP